MRPQTVDDAGRETAFAVQESIFSFSFWRALLPPRSLNQSLMTTHDSVEQLRLQYQALFGELRASQTREKEMIRQCREATQKLVLTTSKLQKLAQLKGVDMQTISALRKEVDQAWRARDLARAREALAMQLIERLRVQCQSLRVDVKKLSVQITRLKNDPL